MKPMTLTPTDQQRLERLARTAGRSPRSMMRFVLRDGFNYCEWAVRESLASQADFKRRGTVPHAEVRRMARAAIAIVSLPARSGSRSGLGPGRASGVKRT